MRRATAPAALRLVDESAVADADLLDTRDDRGQTPLLQAAAAGLAPVVARLLAAGADDRARDKRGRDAIALAARCGGDAGVEVRKAIQAHDAARAAAPVRPFASPEKRPAPPVVGFATPTPGPSAKEDMVSPALPSYAPSRPPPRPQTDRKKPPPRHGRSVRLLSATPQH